MSKNKIISVFSVFLVFILFIAMKPGDNPVILMRVVSISTAVVFVGMILYTRVLWKVFPFNKMHNVMDISGKWQGKLNLDDGKYYEVDVHVVQYLDDIKVKIKSNDFCDDSLVCKMSCNSSGTYLYFVYKSKPITKLDSRDQIDYGTFIVKCDEDYLDGTFFTLSRMLGKVELYRK